MVLSPRGISNAGENLPQNGTSFANGESNIDYSRLLRKDDLLEFSDQLDDVTKRSLSFCFDRPKRGSKSTNKSKINGLTEAYNKSNRLGKKRDCATQQSVISVTKQKSENIIDNNKENTTNELNVHEDGVNNIEPLAHIKSIVEDNSGPLTNIISNEIPNFPVEQIVKEFNPEKDPTATKPIKQTKKTKSEQIPTRSNPKRKARKDCPYRDLDDSMSSSVYDFGYQQSDAGGGNSNSVSKYMTSKGHHSSSEDSYHNNDTSSRQQLHDIATSMASLSNIGNSCYMNSVIYTLRFTPLFLHNLHHLVHDFSQIINKKECQTKLKSSSLGRNITGLQGQNARSWSSKDLVSLGSSSSSSSSPGFDVTKTTQQIAIEKLHELFQNLSNNESAETIEPYHSDLFLKAIQDVNPIFEGNQQQDAHEFLMCILDSIRETCQSLTKIVTEHPELIANGYVSLSDQVEAPIVKPLTTPQQQISEKKSTGIWFRKKKEDKSKNIRLDSPSKDSDSIDSSGSGFASTTNASANNNSSNGEISAADKQIIQEKIKALGLDFFSQEFEGVTASSTLCLSCEAVTEQKETMIDLSVPITDNLDGLDINNSFIQKLCITREQFHGDNKFRCEQCMGYTEAIRTISYPQLPRLLIIQLKRFSGGMEKINSYIPTPFTLQCFCSSCCSKNDQAKDHEYRLYSVITHVGATMCAGHYIAYTCSLNLHSAYINCPKDIKRKEAQAAASTAAASTASAAATSSSASSSTTSQKSSSNSSHGAIVSGVVKKIVFGNRKTSSSGDVMKGLKNINGIKGLNNGVDKSNSTINNTPTTTPTNTTTICPSSTCCSIKMKSLPLFSTCNNTSTTNNLSNGIDYREHSRSSSLSSYGEQFLSSGMQSNTINSSSGNSTASSSKLNSEPIWYMCDDEKIKAMSQHEFVEALTSNKNKNMITPYLLFYARNDIFLPPQ